ncbi:MAG: septum formation protein Maf [Acidobacteria bacterium]|nr:septum formation protein Maf [Acidobacteriota bacterium]
MIELPKLILASGSPRRAEILTSVGWDFTKHVADIDETEYEGELPEDYVVRLAREKSAAVSSGYPGEFVLGADTTVVIEEQIIAKPIDLDDARRMLSLLSGNWHEVLTGVAVVRDSEIRSGIQSTRVKFAPMSEAEINFLAQRGDPLDKAGAYAVQAQAIFSEGKDAPFYGI